MSGNKLIDDYLSDLMDEADTAAPAVPSTEPTHSDSAPAGEPDRGDAAPAPDAPGAAEYDVDEHDAGERDANDRDANDPPADADRPEDASAADAVVVDSDPQPTDRPDPVAAAPDPVADVDPLAGFRAGGRDISDDEFEAMLDVLAGKAPAPPAEPAVAVDPVLADAPPAAPAGDPLAAFRAGGNDISEDEFEAMLDALSGNPPSAAVSAAPEPEPDSVAVAVAPAPPVAAAPVVAAMPAVLNPALAELLAMETTGTPRSLSGPEPGNDRRQRRAEERVTSWLRFSIARQSFAVEVLKVQEVLRLPNIMPVRGTERAMLGAMNLRGQIVPVMDLALKLGFPVVERTEASRVIVLEEHGETLGLLVASVADVANVSDARIERISGTPSLVAADVVRGIARRDGNIIILLDASRLLA